MATVGWLTRSLADVPTGNEWLSAREREALAGFSAHKRRTDWRLGRWAAKAAVAAWSGVAPGEVEILTAEDGAPQALVEGEPAKVSLSLSHRRGRGLVAVAEPEVAIGCDLEAIEPRSDAFLRAGLHPDERADVLAAAGADRARLANLIWSAKEAAAKARRQGLGLDARRVVVAAERTGTGAGGWRPLVVRWEREAAKGWWREEPSWVLAVVSEPRTPAPERL